MKCRFAAYHLKAVQTWFIMLCMVMLSNLQAQNTAGLDSSHLESGLALFEEGKLMRAKKVLSKYSVSDPQHVQCQLSLAWIDHWLGNQSAAIDRLNMILKDNRNLEEAMQLLHEIQLIRSPIISFTESFQADDQPMDRLSSVLEGKWYRSNLLSPEVNLSHYSFTHDSSNRATLITIGNTFFEPNSRISFQASGGMSAAQSNQLVWSFTAERTFFKSLKIQGNLERIPYFYNAFEKGRNDRASVIQRNVYILTKS